MLRTTAALLLLVAGPRLAASQGLYLNNTVSGYPEANVLHPPGYSNSTFATATANAFIPAKLSGLTFRVSVGYGNVNPSNLRPSNAMYVSPTSPAVAAWASLPAGSAMRVARSDVGGSNPDMFDWACGLGGGDCNVEYWWPKFPADVSTSDAGLGCTYILNDLQIDFCGGSITEVATRRLFFGYLSPYQSYNLVVVTTLAQLQAPPLSERLWTWAKPFDWRVWLVLFMSLLFGGIFFYTIENMAVKPEGADETEEEEDEPASKSDAPRKSFTRSPISIQATLQLTAAEKARMLKKKQAKRLRGSDGLVHAVFLAMTSITTVDDHEPTTTHGRIFTLAKGFSIWILMASYIANFASFLTVPPVPFQKITGFDSFSTQGVPACTYTSALINALTAQLYPSIQLINTHTSKATDVLDMILNGTCYGGIMSGPDVQPAINNPGIATYCPLEVLTGDPSAVSLNYAVPYALNSSKLTAPVVTAFNMLFDNMQTTGYYGSNIEPLYYTFDRDPSLCGPYQASLQPAVIPGAQPLMLEDLAGLFILQAIGAGLGLVSLILERTVHKLLKHRASRRDAEAGEGGAAPAELPEADKIPASEI